MGTLLVAWRTSQTQKNYIAEFEATKVLPYGNGGSSKGYVKGRAVQELIKAADAVVTQKPNTYD